MAESIITMASSGFKDDVQYTEKDFANIWNAMIGYRRPRITPSINEDGTWTISTIATSYRGYGFYNNEIIEINWINETEPIFYMWLKTDTLNENFEIIFDTTGDDLSQLSSETVGYDYLFDAVRDDNGKYQWFDSPRLMEDNPALRIFEPVIIEKVINTNDIVTLTEPLLNFKRVRLYCAGTDSTAMNNTILEALIPFTWTNGITARAGSIFDTSSAGVTPGIILKSLGQPNTFQIINNFQLWHYYTVLPAHKSVINLRVVRIELYRY